MINPELKTSPGIRHLKYFGTLLLYSLAVGCIPQTLLEPPLAPADPSGIPNPARGRDFLINHSVLRVGVPVRTLPALKLSSIEPADPVKRLPGRKGLNRFIPTSASGKRLGTVSTMMENCLLCHAGTLRGEQILGLGNTWLDSTKAEDDAPFYAEKLGRIRLQEDEKQALASWLDYYNGARPYTISTSPGTITALYFTGFFFSHRNPKSFEWEDKPYYPMLSTPNPETDVPAWWLLKKKSALYYGGEVTGDFTRSLMQFMSPKGNTLADIQDSEPIFRDVLAYLKTLTPPPFPKEIDRALAGTGRAIFDRTCSKCHGTYDDALNPDGTRATLRDDYPTELVSLEKVGTDPARSEFMRNLPFAAHYNQTWYGEHSSMTPTSGYVAPPLDGVWATAPYLHNGSVPTLEALLTPELRPAYFIKHRNSRAYDLEKVGWQVEVLSHGKDGEADAQRRRDIYDTTQFGKSNQGHDFGLKLTLTERRAVLEYLKTL